MTAWLLRTIGIGGELTERVDDLQWLAARPIWLWAAALGTPLLLLAIHRRHRASIGHIRAWARHVLTACRVAFFVLLMIALAGPYVRLHQQVTTRPLLAVVVDESASMGLAAGPFDGAAVPGLAAAAGLTATGDAEEPDRQSWRKQLGEMSRADLTERVLGHGETTWLASVADRLEVRHYRVASEVRQVQAGTAPLQLTTEQAQDSALGVALQRVFDDAAGRPLAGIVMLTDGRSTRGADPLGVVRAAAQVGVQAAPVFAIPVGSATSPGPDAAVVDVLAPQRVSAKDTVSLIATVAATGLDGREVKVRLTEGDEVLDEATLVLDSRPSQQVTLTCDAPEAGTRLLQVEVTPQPDETITDNNRAAASLDVDSRKRRVLVLEGYPRWDYRFLDHELRRDHGLEVTVVMESSLRDAGVAAGELPEAAELPSDAEAWAKFDAVVVGDVSRDLLPERVQAQLARAVEDEGVGLLVQAGFASMPHAFMDEASPLARLLPVRVAAADASGGIDAPAFAPLRMSVTSQGSIHPALRLYPGAERNRAVWSQMPTFFWAADVTAAKPAATVVAEVAHEGRQVPLVVEHWAGRGRVLFIGVDSTYRWRRNIGSALFGRFWNQAIRHVAKSDQTGGDQTLLLASPGRVEQGEPVQIELFLGAADRRTSPSDGLTLTITGPDDSVQRTTLRPSGEGGYFTGTWRPARQGRFTLTYSGGAEPVTTTVVATASGREMAQPTVDRAGLRALASVSGGAMLELDQLGELPERLKGEPSTVSRVIEDEVWDNWFALVLLVGLYCVDVGIRRLHGLT